LPEADKNADQIKEFVTLLWDSGIEVSHTVRQYSDITKLLEEDLHAFTQFFETRFLFGKKSIYKKWNEEIINSLTEEHRKNLIYKFFDDIKSRHKKYGGSPKVLEPNVKSSAGGLRDLHTVEWIYSIKNNIILTNQKEITQTERFLDRIKNDEIINSRTVTRLLNSYAEILRVRNFLHIIHKRKQDRFEFKDQERIAITLGANKKNWKKFMYNYFSATNIVHRFSKTIVKKYTEQITTPLSEFLSIDLDDDFSIKDNILSIKKEKKLPTSDLMRVFYYRGFYNAQFSQSLRSLIIECALDAEESEDYKISSSVFFREILKLSKNVGNTLSVMNELGVLGAFFPEFRELIGFFQPGVYHCYTADEHTLIALKNVENLSDENSTLGSLFCSIKRRDILYLAILFHDIAKPISVSGHEIIGAEIAETIMQQIGYSAEEIDLVQFLVKNHLTMEQVAFRRNLNDASTLNKFTSLFPSIESLDLLYLLTYADLSAVSPVVWTNWKSDLLDELFHKANSMLAEKLSGEELLYENTMRAISDPKIADNDIVKSHVESINDMGYLSLYSNDEINAHVKEIESGSDVSVFFKKDNGFTNITVISRDSESLLSRLCGALSINDLNIHDARIFTRKDGIIIDSFNVTDFRTHENIDESRFDNIKNGLISAVENQLQLSEELNKIKSKWWRIENKFFKRTSKIKISFEEHDKYSIIDVFSPDRLGLLYQITKKMNELGLVIYFAKIATKSDDVVDAFYVLDRNKNMISVNEHELITMELTSAIEEIL